MNRPPFIETLFLVMLVALAVVGCKTEPPPMKKGATPIPQAGQTPLLSSEALPLTINGVGLGMTLDQVKELAGPGLRQNPNRPSAYSFETKIGKQALKDLTTIEVGEDETVNLVSGDRLELKGHPIAEDYFLQTEQERLETMERLESLLGPLELQKQFGGARAALPQHKLTISITKNGQWVFRLGGL
jgi:hypothetical protein